MKKVFLTGVTGFIGLHVARLLLEDDVELYALLRAGSDTWRIQDIAPQIHFITGDLLDLASFADDLSAIQPQICIHTAWDTTPSQYLTSPNNIELLHATLKLTQFLETITCERLIGIGTCIEHDTSYGYLSEETPIKPNTLYGACKASLFLTMQQLDISTAWLRLFQPYGIYENSQRLIPQVISYLLGGKPIATTTGEQIRDFTDARDIARAIWMVANSDVEGDFNIGTGQPKSVHEVLTMIGEKLNRLDLIRFGERPQRPGEAMFICANPSRIQQQTSWKPEISLSDGLDHVIAWWQAAIEST